MRALAPGLFLCLLAEKHLNRIRIENRLEAIPHAASILRAIDLTCPQLRTFRELVRFLALNSPLLATVRRLPGSVAAAEVLLPLAVLLSLCERSCSRGPPRGISSPKARICR